MKNNEQSYGRFDFIGKAGLFSSLSVVMVVVSLIYLGVRGISYGIDFAGGTEIQVKFGEKVTIEQLRQFLTQKGLPDASLQEFGEGSEFLIRFQAREGKSDKETNELQNRLVETIRTGVTQEFAASQPDIRRVDTVGPQVGEELKKSGILATFYCILMILIYVALRFDYKYAPGAVLCLIHDAIVTLAVFVAVGKVVDIPTLAAIMTLIGYSINDTIVVFDRIRETAHEHDAQDFGFIINKSINDMFTRTVITSGTTMVSALFLYLFAGGTVADIAFVILLGVAFGTYSSIYIAAPMVLWMDKINRLRAAKA